MAKVRLEAAGHFVPNGDVITPGEVLERDAMLVYTGKFQSMDGEVDVNDEHLDRLVGNHNSMLSRLSRLANGDVPIKHCPPIQVDHSTSAMMTVGRVVGQLRAQNTEIDGKQLKAVFGRVRILGLENVQRVVDGRWTHLSIGADLDAGKLNELSITPFPAASEASMLSRLSRQIYKDHEIETVDVGGDRWKYKIDGEEMPEYCGSNASAMKAAKAWIDELISNHELKGADMDKEKLKKHLMESEKMSAEDADKKLASLSDDDMKKMSAEVDDKEKKMAAQKEEDAKKLAAEKAEADKKEKDEKDAKMAAAKAKFVTLAKGIKVAGSQVQLAARVATINARLSGLRAQAKITPAEIKKINVAELAAKADDVVEASLKTYADREPVIDAGVYGTQKAEELTKLAAKYKLAREEMESRLRMPSKRADAEKRLKELNAEEEAETVKLKSGVEQGGKSGSEDEKNFAITDEKQMSALVENLKRLQTDFQEVISLVGPSLGVESKDLE